MIDHVTKYTEFFLGGKYENKKIKKDEMEVKEKRRKRWEWNIENYKAEGNKIYKKTRQKYFDNT